MNLIESNTVTSHASLQNQEMLFVCSQNNFGAIIIKPFVLCGEFVHFEA